MTKKILITNPKDILLKKYAYFFDEYLYNLIGEKKKIKKIFFLVLNI